MASNAYLIVEGPDGLIEGDATASEHVGKIEVWGVNHEVLTDFQVGGQAVARAEHRPLRIVKPVDRATPLLADAGGNGDPLTRVVLELYEADANGTLRRSLTLELQGAVVVSNRIEMLDNRYLDNELQPVKEMVAFAYQKILWTHEPTGITAESDWTGA